MTSHPDHIFNFLCVYEGRLENKFIIKINISGLFIFRSKMNGSDRPVLLSH